MIRALVFDLGHTLWDIEPLDPAELEAAYDEAHAALCAARGAVGLPSPEELRHAVSDILHEYAETYFAAGPALEQPPTHWFVETAWRRLGLELQEALLREITPGLFGRERVACDGVAEVLGELSAAGYRIGCVTNTLASDGAIRDALREAGVLDLMQSIVVSSEEGFRKPHPALFEKAMREMGAAPAESAFVGDSPYHDIGGAKACGMKAVLTTQYARRPWIEGVPEPDAVIQHLRELRAVLESGFARNARTRTA
jgi:HAD superfamily hydrolase (TIGR01662 family)